MNRNKTKPSLLDLHSTSHLAQQLGGPPSPTMSTTSFMSSVSWMAEKSSADLIPMLKNAYHALKDKERDLMLAAEIGKSLLENNIAMKNRYEELLNNTRSTPMLKGSLDTSSLTTTAAGGGGDALPTPSSSVLTTSQRYGSDSGIESCLESGSDYEDDDDEDNDDPSHHTMRFVPSRSTREAMIEVLELKNTELNAHLETILEEQSHMDKSNTKKHRELEQEISALTNSLEIATSKIQELEDMNKRANQRRSNDSHGNPSNPNDDDAAVDRQMMDELLDQIDSLKTENDTTLQSKIDLETKLAHTLQDLRKLKEQFDHFQFTKDDHEDLKAAYERQFKHIDELNASVEEHRSMLQKLKDRGIPIHATPAPSCIDGMDPSSSSSGYRNTLLGELENEWMKQQQQLSDHLQSSAEASSSAPEDFVSSPTSYLKPSFSALSLKDLSSFTGQSISAMYQQSDFGMESVLARAAGIDQKSLEEAIRFVDRLEDQFGHDDWRAGDDLTMTALQDHDDNDDNDNAHLLTMFDPAFPRDGLYPDASLIHKEANTMVVATTSTFSGKIQNTVRLFFKAVWRWCRFAVILSTAVLISVWNGPDYMLLEN